MLFHAGSFLLAAALLWGGSSDARAQDGDSSWAAAAMSQAGQALKSADASPAAPTRDIPKIRESARRMTVSVSITCADGQARYSLRPISAALGPSFSAYANSLQSDSFYPQENGLSLALKDDGDGAALWIGRSGAEMRKLGGIATGAGACRGRDDYVDLSLDGAVSAGLSVEPRTGIFRPACYKDIINGFYKLDTWTILTLAFPQEALTVKVKDSEPFPDEGACRAFYERVKASR